MCKNASSPCLGVGPTNELNTNSFLIVSSLSLALLSSAAPLHQISAQHRVYVHQKMNMQAQAGVPNRRAHPPTKGKADSDEKRHLATSVQHFVRPPFPSAAPAAAMVIEAWRVCRQTQAKHTTSTRPEREYLGVEAVTKAKHCLWVGCLRCVLHTFVAGVFFLSSCRDKCICIPRCRDSTQPCLPRGSTFGSSSHRPPFASGLLGSWLHALRRFQEARCLHQRRCALCAALDKHLSEGGAIKVARLFEAPGYNCRCGPNHHDGIDILAMDPSANLRRPRELGCGHCRHAHSR